MNFSMNTSIQDHLITAYTLPSSSKIILYLVYTATFIVGTFTNSFVIYYVGVKNKLTKRFDVYLISLATTDLLASICLPTVTVHEIWTNKSNWNLLGDVGCKIFQTSLPFTMLVSAIMLVLIATGRLRVIKSSIPMPHVRVKTIKETMFVWFFSFIMLVPYSSFITLDYSNKCHDPTWSEHYGYYIVIESSICILPLVAMVVVYTASSYFILNRNVPTSGNKRISTRRRQQYKEMTKMFFVLVVVFLVCTAPHSIKSFVYYSRRQQAFLGSDKVEIYLENFFRLLMAFHHCINPYIYSRMHKSLRKYLRRFMRQLHGKFTLNDENETGSQFHRAADERNETTIGIESFASSLFEKSLKHNINIFRNSSNYSTRELIQS